jgi:hypothetical protein
MPRGVFALGLVAFLFLGSWSFLVEPAVRQPVEFPHKAHLDLKDQKFECTTCHDQADKGAVAGRPSTKKCLSCHSGASAKSPEEKKLQALAVNGREIPWRRVWRLPAHVFFSHRTHVALAKVKCQTCHGAMETLTRPPARPLKKLAMDDCIGCHEQWRWPAPPAHAGALAPGSVRSAGGRPVSTDCNACHR